MDKWAANPAFKDVAFFCICVESSLSRRKNVTKNFVNELKIQNTYIGYFENEHEMPTWGQLGCQGFIVATSNGSVLVPRSPMWTELRENALRWMENMFRSITATRQELNDVVEVVKVQKLENKKATAKEKNQIQACSSGTCSKRITFDGVEPTRVGSMDAEHDQILTLLRSLEIKRDCPSIKASLDCMIEHFEHEERLLVQHKFGGESGCNLIDGHKGDHQAIIKMIQQEESQMKAFNRAASPQFLMELAERFAFHTQEYDSRYADFFVNKGVN